TSASPTTSDKTRADLLMVSIFRTLTASTDTCTLSLHDALPIYDPVAAELLASARAGTAPGAAGGDLAAVAGAGGQGAVVFAANCAECHGPMGEGGMGAALAGNPRAANEGNVRDAVTFGRGMMPGFGATLQPDELEAVIAYVVEVVPQR